VKTAISKHSIKVRGRTTSVRLEDPFWNAMRLSPTSRGLRGQSLSPRSIPIASTPTCPRRFGFSFSITTGLSRQPASRLHRKQKQSPKARQAVDRSCVVSRNQISIEAGNISAQQVPIADARCLTKNQSEGPVDHRRCRAALHHVLARI
jgi:Ribbon-helix-helix domain